MQKIYIYYFSGFWILFLFLMNISFLLFYLFIYSFIYLFIILFIGRVGSSLLHTGFL